MATIHDVRTYDEVRGIAAAHRMSGLPVLLEFHAVERCAPCKAVWPTVASTATQGRVAALLTADIDDCPELAADMGVVKLPTFVLFRGGAEVGRVVGADMTRLDVAIYSSSGGSSSDEFDPYSCEEARF